jgi:hypothetical protein
MSWEKIGVLKPDRIHRSGDTTKIPAAEAACADLYARTARGEAPASLCAHALFGKRKGPATRTPSTAHSCVKGKRGGLPALCLPQADVVEEDCSRELGHVGVFGVERAVNATPRVHGMQPAQTPTRGGARPSGTPGMRQSCRRIWKCAEGSGKCVPFCRGAAPAHLSLVEGMWSQRKSDEDAPGLQSRDTKGDKKGFSLLHVFYTYSSIVDVPEKTRFVHFLEQGSPCFQYPRPHAT